MSAEHQAHPAGTDPPTPLDLVVALTDWAQAHPWCRWLELAGSLADGRGDALSDVDAGVGVEITAVDVETAAARARAAVAGFGPVTGTLIQDFAAGPSPAFHLVVQYADGRQLSLVVMDARTRDGLPPGSRALLDRDDRLARSAAPRALAAGDDDRREWAFLAWLALGDLAKHVQRGRLWRANGALQEAREQVWKLHAAALGIDYPAFGAVSVENEGRAAPAGLERSLPARLDRASLLAGGDALAPLLEPLTGTLDVDGVRDAALARLRVAAASPPPPSDSGAS